MEMRENNIKRINEFVNKNGIGTLKENLKGVKLNITCFEQYGENEYRKLYPRSSYNLEELKYFEKSLRKKIRELKKMDNDYLKRLKPYEFV